MKKLLILCMLLWSTIAYNQTFDCPPENMVFVECQIQSLTSQLLEKNDDLLACQLELQECNQGGTFTQDTITKLNAIIDSLAATSVSWFDMVILNQQLIDCQRSNNAWRNQFNDMRDLYVECLGDLAREESHAEYMCTWMNVWVEQGKITPPNNHPCDNY